MFDAKSDEGAFVVYSSTCKAYRVFNKRTLLMEGSMHVKFHEFGEKGDDVDDQEIEELTIDKEES